jgi:hypothetical protein
MSKPPLDTIQIAITAATFVGVGAFALLAAVGTGVGMMFIANRRIAFREEADRVSGATRDAALVTSEHTATTVHLDGLRDAGGVALTGALDAPRMRVAVYAT